MFLPLVVLLFLQAAAPAETVKSYLEWRSQQADQTNTRILYAKYREHLRQKGLSQAEIADAFRVIDIERWDTIYTNPTPIFNTAPNAFMVEVVKGLKPGLALDIGMGQGRNSLHLARNGWEVTGIDTSEQGMEIARKSAAAAGVKIATINIPMEEFDYGVGKWDLIVATYEGAGWREKAVQGLKPGGVVIVEGFLRGRGTPSGASFSPNELVKLFLDLNLRILRYEDVAGKPDWSPEPTGRVVRLCAQKPE